MSYYNNWQVKTGVFCGSEYYHHDDDWSIASWKVILKLTIAPLITQGIKGSRKVKA